MDGLRIEQARPEHAREIEELELQAFSVDPLRLAHAAFARKNEPVIVLVATHRGRVCGYVTASTCWHGRSLNLWLMALAVAPEHRQRGVGKGLLSAMLAAGRSLRATRVRLYVRPENAPALGLYLASGFHVLARTPDALGPGKDVLVMVRSTRPTGRSERRR